MNRIGILADIKKAFYQVAIADEHNSFFPFLWLDSSSVYDSIVVFHFLRAIMGVMSSSFLLNATLRLHLGKYLGSDLKELVQKVLEDLHVDGLVSGSESVEQGKLLFEKCKKVMSDAGFELRKWVTNDPKLSLHFLSQEKMIANEQEVVSFLDTIFPHCDKHSNSTRSKMGHSNG